MIPSRRRSNGRVYHYSHSSLPILYSRRRDSHSLCGGDDTADFWPAVAALLSSGIGLLGISIYLMNRGEKYRKDWKDEVDQLTAHRLHSLYIDFMVNGASEISRLTQVSSTLAPLQRQISGRIAQSQDVGPVKESLSNAFSKIELSFNDDKHLREAIGSLVQDVGNYEEERRLFKDAWESEVKLGRTVAKIAGIVFAAGVDLVPVAFATDVSIQLLSYLLLFPLMIIGGGFFFDALAYIRTQSSSREALQDLIETEQFGVSGVQSERP